MSSLVEVGKGQYSTQTYKMVLMLHSIAILSVGASEGRVLMHFFSIQAQSRGAFMNGLTIEFIPSPLHSLHQNWNTLRACALLLIPKEDPKENSTWHTHEAIKQGPQVLIGLQS